MVYDNNADDRGFFHFLEEKNRIIDLETKARARLVEAKRTSDKSKKQELISEYEHLSRQAALRRQYVRGKYGL